MNKLKREALLLIAGAMKPEEVAGLKNIFKAIDTDNSGTITVEEMKLGLRSQGSVISEDELNQLVAGLDADNSGRHLNPSSISVMIEATLNCHICPQPIDELQSS